jgi:hypothetical protein
MIIATDFLFRLSRVSIDEVMEHFFLFFAFAHCTFLCHNVPLYLSRLCLCSEVALFCADLRTKDICQVKNQKIGLTFLSQMKELSVFNHLKDQQRMSFEHCHNIRVLVMLINIATQTFLKMYFLVYLIPDCCQCRTWS